MRQFPSSPTVKRALHLAMLAGLAGLVALASPQPQAVSAQSAEGDIVETAIAAGNFNTLVSAVQAAGLVETLKSSGDFTVFAPTDAAFAKLPAGTVDQLLANPEQLRAVLTYHVVPGRVTASDLPNNPTAQTVQGASLQFSLNPPRVNNANIVQADVTARNGVIHAIDTVLLPPTAAPSQLPRAGEGDSAGPLGAGLAALALLLGGLGLRLGLARFG